MQHRPDAESQESVNALMGTSHLKSTRKMPGPKSFSVRPPTRIFQQPLVVEPMTALEPVLPYANGPTFTAGGPLCNRMGMKAPPNERFALLRAPLALHWVGWGALQLGTRN